MRNKNYQSVFLVVGIILHVIYLYVGIKVFWFIGCGCTIISLFLPGGFSNINCQKSAKGQEGKKYLQEPKNCTSDSIEKDSEQDNFPPS